MESQTQPPYLEASFGGRRLLFFSLPLQGHITPMLHLAQILHSNGFSITFVHTQFNSPNPSNYPYFTFLPIPDNLSESETATLSVFDLAYLINANCLEPFRDCLARLFSDSSDNRPCALISDPALNFTREVADTFALPRFVLRTSGVGAFRAFNSFPSLQTTGYLPIKASQLEEPVPDLSPLRVKDLPAINVPNIEIFTKFIAELVEEARTSSGVIFNSFQELEDSAISALRKTFPARIFPIGPFHRYSPPTSSSSYLKPDESAITWLDRQEPKSVVYVSFGSVASVKESECLEIAWGLANSKCRFLWVIRLGSVNGLNSQEALPDGFLDALDGRGYVVEWAPQLEVLAHPSVGAFWTHCGWNSTLESICEGVPMICMPCFADQMVNSRYVTYAWKIGVELRDGLERDNIERVVRRVMVEKEGREIRQRALELKEIAKSTLTPHGASYESLKRLIGCLSSS